MYKIVNNVVIIDIITGYYQCDAVADDEDVDVAVGRITSRFGLGTLSVGVSRRLLARTF